MSPAAVATLALRRATTADARAIHALIADHQQEGHLLPRDAADVHAHAHRFVVACDGERVVACVDLAPLSERVAEVRSLVVSERARSMGVGRRLLGELVRRASEEAFDLVCAFTHAPEFFVKMGFAMVPHAWVPEKIERSCRTCALFRRCGQHAVVLPLATGHA